MATKTRYRPSNAREARLWNIFNSGEEFFPIWLWPTWAQSMALLDHKNSEQVFNLLVFFVGNGFAPALAIDWILSHDASGGSTLLKGSYSAKEISEAKGLLKRAEAGNLLKGKTKRVYDMNLCRPAFFSGF